MGILGGKGDKSDPEAAKKNEGYQKSGGESQELRDYRQKTDDKLKEAEALREALKQEDGEES